MMSNCLLCTLLDYYSANWHVLDYLIVGVTLSYFATVIWIDIRNYRIPFLLSGVGLVISLIWGAHFNTIMNALLGGLAGLVSVSLLYLGGLFFRRIVNRNSRVELETPFGFGDVPFGVIMGMFMGWPDVICGFIIAFILAGIFALLILLLRKESHKIRALPLAPFFIAGWLFSSFVY